MESNKLHLFAQESGNGSRIIWSMKTERMFDNGGKYEGKIDQ